MVSIVFLLLGVESLLLAGFEWLVTTIIFHPIGFASKNLFPLKPLPCKFSANRNYLARLDRPCRDGLPSISNAMNLSLDIKAVTDCRCLTIGL
jgi:hypothetical protein